MWNKQSRVVLVYILSTVFAAALLTSIPGRAAQLPEDNLPYEIPDGIWTGAFSGSDVIAVSGGTAEAYFDGTMDLSVIAGQASGSFDANGTSSSESNEGYGIATFNASGELGGTAAEPWMLTHSAFFDFAIIVNGYETSFPISEDHGFMPVDLDLTESANCNSMSGNFDSSVVQSAENANVNVLSVKTEFTIIRFAGIASNTPETYSNVLLELMKQADQLISDTLKNQSLDADLLFEVITKADGLNSGIIYDVTCAYGKTGNYFNTAIIGIMAKLVNLAYAHPDWFTAQQINQIAYAALSTGAIGAGSPNEDQAVNLTNLLEEIATEKLTEASKSPQPNCGDIYAIYTVSQLLSTESLLLKSTEAMNTYQCQGS